MPPPDQTTVTHASGPRAGQPLTPAPDDTDRRREWAAALRWLSGQIARQSDASDWVTELADRIESGDLTPWADQPEPSTPPAVPSGAAPAAAGPHPDTPDRAGSEELDLAPIEARARPGTAYGSLGQLAASADDVPALLAEVRLLRGLVSPAAGRVLDAVMRWRDQFAPGPDPSRLPRRGELIAAWDALDGDRPAEQYPCERYEAVAEHARQRQAADVTNQTGLPAGLKVGKLRAELAPEPDSVATDLAEPTPAAADDDPLCATCRLPIRRGAERWVHLADGSDDFDPPHPADPISPPGGRRPEPAPEPALSDWLAAIDNALRNGSYMTNANLAFELLCDWLRVDRRILTFDPMWSQRPDHPAPRPAEPAPEPDSGPGWERESVNQIIGLVRRELGAPYADALDALLADRDRLRVERDATGRLNGGLNNALAEVTADRDRLRHTIAAAGRSAEDSAEYARQGWGEVERLREKIMELEAATTAGEPSEPADDCLRTAAEVRARGEAECCGWCGARAAAHPDAVAVATLDTPTEPAPEPDSGPGWDRDTIDWLATYLDDNGSPHAEQLRALLVDRDASAHDEAQWRDLAIQHGQERDVARAEVAEARATLARFAGGEDEVRAELARAIEERDLVIAHDRQPYPTADAYERVCAALERKRAELAEMERDRNRWTSDAAAWERRADELSAELRQLGEQRAQERQQLLNRGADHLERADRAEVEVTRLTAEVDRLRGELETAASQAASRWQRMIELRQELATARRDAAADALDWAVDTAAEYRWTNVKLSQLAEWAAEVRAGTRPVLGSPQPASTRTETTEEAS